MSVCVCVCVCVCAQTDRQTTRPTYRETERDRERQTDRYRQTYKPDKLRERQVQTERGTAKERKHGKLGKQTHQYGSGGQRGKYYVFE